jgi:glutathione synthase/RimK-type ligase-like ATP-grasp enzyme
MKVLLTSSRMPFAVGMIRKLADAGHSVYASDDYELAPGSHSRYLEDHFVTASPRGDTEQFISDVERIASEQGIDVIVPAFEEAFYLSTQHDRLSKAATLYFAPFSTLARLHDKAAFQSLVTELGLRTPETIVASSDDELRAALDRFPRYFARAAFSRGGVSLLSNTGPLAGHLSVDDCHPTPESPWLVQEFVDGPMMCTYTTMHRGRASAHCAYRAPRQWEHSTAIQFLSVEGRPTMSIAERIAGHFGYTGQMSLDFVDSDGELYLIECNPRATDGALLLSSDDLAEGLLNPDREAPMLVEPGKEVELDMAVFAQMFTEGLREVPRSIDDLARVRGSDTGWHDHLPTLYSFLALCHHAKLELHERKSLMTAMAEDISWDGEPIAGLSADDAALLAGLEDDRQSSRGRSAPGITPG